jgi:hypothetical protein
MSDAAIREIVQQAGTRSYNWNRDAQTRQLRDAIRQEVNLRPGLSNLTPP